MFPAIIKAPEALNPEDYAAVRQCVILVCLWHSVGRHDKCDELHAALKELCPEATEPWCPCCIQRRIREEGKHSAANIAARVQEAEDRISMPAEHHVGDTDDDDSDNFDCEDEEESPLSGLSATPPQGDQQGAEPQGYFGKCADIPEVVYDQKGKGPRFRTSGFDSSEEASVGLQH